jgi:hypothetical protein
MTPRADDTTSTSLEWLRQDMGRIQDHMIESGNRLATLTASVDGIGERLSAHCGDPNAHGPRSMSMAPGGRSSTVTWLIRLAPILLAAALGLLGLGAYVGGGESDDDTTRAIRAVADTTARLAAELAQVRAAVDGGD